MEVSCFVEVAKGSRNKYEYDEERGVLRLDRRLFASVFFPADYGFIEDTLTTGRKEGRGTAGTRIDSHLDTLILNDEPTFPGCRIAARPIGVFRMSDEDGVDDKVLCLPLGDPEWEEVDELNQVSRRVLEEIEHFFLVYKDLEPGRASAIEGWAGRAEAEKEVGDALRLSAERGR